LNLGNSLKVKTSINLEGLPQYQRRGYSDNWSRTWRGGYI